MCKSESSHLNISNINILCKLHAFGTSPLLHPQGNILHYRDFNNFLDKIKSRNIKEFLIPCMMTLCLKKENKSSNRLIHSFNFFPRVYARIGGMGSEIALDKGKSLFHSETNESGWDRLVRMYSKTEFGHLSPEVNYILSGTSMAFVIGSLLGLYSEYRYGDDEIIRKKSPVSTNYMDLAKKKQKVIFTKLVRGSLRAAVQVSFLSGVALTIICTAEAYNNYKTPVEYAVAGGICFSLVKLKSGIPSMARTGALGGLIGLGLGTASVGIMKLRGSSLQEERYWQHHYWEKEIKNQIAKIEEIQKKKETKTEDISKPS